MAKTKSIFTDPKKDKILKELVDSDFDYKRISIKYDYPRNDIYNLVYKRLTREQAKYMIRNKDQYRKHITEKFLNSMDNIAEISESYREWLMDSEGNINIDTRASEVDCLLLVTERDEDGNIYKRKKNTTLQEVVEYIEGNNPDLEVVSLKANRVDNRKLYLDTLALNNKTLELLAKITDNMPEIQVNQQINVYNAVGQFMRIVADELSADRYSKKLDSIVKRIGNEIEVDLEEVAHEI